MLFRIVNAVSIIFLAIVLYYYELYESKTLWWSNGVKSRGLISVDSKSKTICEKFRTKNVGGGFLLGRLGEVFATIHASSDNNDVRDATVQSLEKAQQSMTIFLEYMLQTLSQTKELQRLLHHVENMKEEFDDVLQSIKDPPKGLYGNQVDIVCPEDMFVLSANNITFEAEFFVNYTNTQGGHVLHDISKFVMLFPGCKCYGDIPWNFLQRLVKAHKHRLSAYRSFENYEEELMKLSLLHLTNEFVEYKNSPDKQNSKHFVARMKAFLNGVPSLLSSEPERLSKLLPSSRYLISLILNSVPPSSGSLNLPPFPCFKSLERSRINAQVMNSLRQQAIADEHFRLTQVFSDNLTQWISQQPEVKVLEWQEGMSLSDIDLEEPTLIKNAPPTRKWKAMSWKKNVSKFVKAAGKKVFTVKLLVNNSENITRSPLGQGFTFKARASSLFGEDSMVGEQPFYLTQPIDKEKFRKMWKQLRCGEFCNGVRNLWSGSQGVIAPLHFDPFHNMFTQIRGSKHFLLFPPTLLDSSYTHPKLHVKHRQSQINLQDEQLHFWPFQEDHGL